MKNLLENELSDEMLDNVVGGLDSGTIIDPTKCLCGSTRLELRNDDKWYCCSCGRFCPKSCTAHVELTIAETTG